MVAPTVFAEYDPGAHTKVEIDKEPNWETATYICPLSIKTIQGEFRYTGFRISLAGNPQAELMAAPKKYIPYVFQVIKEIDVACEYEGFNTTLIMRLKDVTACGENDKPFRRMACWVTDPYAAKK